MALSGTIYNTVVSQGWQLRIDWSATQSVANNTSTITASMYVYNKYTSHNTGGTAYYIIQGTKTNYNYNYGSTPAWNYLGQKSWTVTHSSDGTCSVTLTGSWFSDISGSSYTPREMSISGTITLNTIPRASDVSVSASSVACGGSITVSVSRKSTAFTHTVQVLYGSTAKTTLVTKGTGSSYTFSPDYATYAPLNTAGTTVSCTVYCYTYNGSTLIGTKTVAVNVTIPNNSTTKPTCTIGNPTKADTVVPASWGIWVRGQSKVTYSPTYGYKYSTSAKSYSISGGGYSSTSSSLTTGVLNTAGDVTFTASVTDKRGFASSASTNTITVVDWQAPTISNVLSQRCNANGTLNDEGKYCKISANIGWSDCNNKQGNSSYPVTFKVYYREYGTSTWTEIYSANNVSGQVSPVIGSGSTFDTEKAYDIKVEVSDTFKTSSYQDVLSTANYCMVLRHGGTGASFGKASELEALESAFPAYFYNGIKGKQNPTDTEWVDVLDKLSILSPLETSYPNMMYVKRTTGVNMPTTYWQIDLGNIGQYTMIGLDIMWMSGYGWNKVHAGGYMYGTNDWSSPFAKKLTNSTVNIDFGYYSDSKTHKWIGLTLGGGYGTYVAVSNIVLGYTENILNKNSINITYSTSGYSGTRTNRIAATW